MSFPQDLDDDRTLNTFDMFQQTDATQMGKRFTKKSESAAQKVIKSKCIISMQCY